MASPRVDQLFVEDQRLFDTLISCFIVFASVKLLSSVGSSLHVYYTFISSVAQLDSAPGCFVEKSLPNLISDVSLTVHDATVAD